MTGRRVKSQPNAVRAMQGLRRTGYTPQTAIADIIDNSISAGATKVHIKHSPNPEYSVVYIADNGCGMSEATLEEAMRYGSSQDLANSNLSVYGLGMKLASSTFSERFTVVTRDKYGIASSATWDLTEQHDTPWEMWIGPAKVAHIAVLNSVAGEGTGTLVIWEKADLKAADSVARQTLNKSTSDSRIENTIKEHLSLTFHRFMNGEAKGYKSLDIYFNTEKLVPFDPVAERYLLADWFHTPDTFTQPVVGKDGKIEDAPYTIQAYFLDPTDDAAHKTIYQESKQELQYQGIYVYRSDRLLQMPDWLTFVTTRHNAYNALRFILEIDPRLDAQIKTDVKKSGVLLPAQMFENLHPIIRGFRGEIERRNIKRRADDRKTKTPKDIHKAASESIYKHRNDFPLPPIERIGRNDIVIKNQYGTNTLRVRDFAQPTKPDNCVLPVDNLDDGVLYEPFFNGTDLLIKLNQSHEFYQKVYLGCLDSPMALEALDTILWSFARAELNSATNIRDQFAEMRQLVSSYLRRYAEDKPDPKYMEENSESN
jgi:hypothetical protein